MLWKVPKHSRGLVPRPEEYQGPSWSWVALKVPVHISSFAETCIYVEILGCYIKGDAASAHFSIDDKWFGAIESGTMELRARLRAAEWIHHLQSSEIDVLHLSQLRVQLYGTSMILPAQLYANAIEPEFAHSNPCYISVFLLPILCAPSDKIDPGKIEGLVLRRSHGSTFSRLGVFSFAERFFDKHKCAAGGRCQCQIEGWIDRQKANRFQLYVGWLESTPLQTVMII
jgi:hypothetical protein